MGAPSGRRLRAPEALLAAGLGLACVSTAGADELTPVHAFRAFNRTTAPELPESIVVDLLQDSEGVLWIDTLGGLATYDGAGLRAVRDADAPRGPAALAERRSGGLYAASRQGLHVFDGAWRRVPTAAPVRALAEEDGSWLWTVQADAVLRTPAAAPGSSWQPVLLPAWLGSPRSLFSDRNDGVYVFGDERIARCNRGDCVATPGDGRRPEHVEAALVTRAGALWLGTSDGRVLSAAPGVEDWTTSELGPWPSGGIRSLAEDREGRIWVGGMARLCHQKGGTWMCWGPESGLPRSAILSLLGDREGTLWLGLNGGGLLQWVGQPWTHRTNWPGETAPGEGLEVIGLAPTAAGGVLASVFGRGILHWDGRRFTAWGAEQGLTEDVRVVVEPTPGEVWAAARHGVFERPTGGAFRRTLALPDGFASGFARDPDGVWHVWTEAPGIFRRSNGAWVHAADLEALVFRGAARAVHWTDSGELWIAGVRELVRRSPGEAVEVHPLGLENGLPDSVTTIAEVGPDEVWVGGHGGIAILKAGRVRLLGEADGVPGNVYFLRRAPDAAVWVGGSRGIARFRNGRFERWDRSSGLVAEECNGGAIVLPDGGLLAATAGSLARFDPAVTATATAPLRVSWREPQGARSGVVERAADERRARFSWRAPWLAPEAIEYATRIGGGPWSAPTADAHLAVENLPAGSTEIAVRARRARLGEDPWSAPAVLRVEVAPHFWETTSARAAAVLLLAATLLAATRLVARRQHARRAQALERLRADFMASASHELRTPIAQIRLFADMLRLGRTRGEAERNEALDTIHRATVRLETLSSNLLQLARGQTSVGEAGATASDVSACVRESLHDLAPLAAARRTRLVAEVEPGLRGGVDAEGLRRIVSNLVDNALKYGPAGQTIRVGAESAADGLRISVEDEGPGIPAVDRERVLERFERLDRDRNSAVSGTGLGLAVVRDVALRAGGAVCIEDASGGGARIVVVLPQLADSHGSSLPRAAP